MIPQMHAVESSKIKAIGYDKKDLYVEFKNGDTFVYYGVSNDEYVALMTSDSIGSAHGRITKGKQFKKV